MAVLHQNQKRLLWYSPITTSRIERKHKEPAILIKPCLDSVEENRDQSNTQSGELFKELRLRDCYLLGPKYANNK